MPDMAETDWFDHLMEQLPGQASQSNHSPFMFYKTLRQLVENPESRIIILFNCLEKSDPKHLRAVVSGLKGIADEIDNKRYNLIFTGGEKLHDLCYKYINEAQSQLNICETRFLPDLSENEAVSLLKRAGWDRHAATEIFRATGGCFPLLQHAAKVCRECGMASERAIDHMETFNLTRPLFSWMLKSH